MRPERGRGGPEVEGRAGVEPRGRRVGLDRRAAENIIAARPFVSIAQLDAVPYVGPVALDLLATYALAHGYGGEPGEPPAPCAIISEYTEGQGNNNKGVELYNCGSAPLALESVGLCLVRNGDTECGSAATIGAGALDAGDVWVVCRTLEGTFNDPMQSLRDACDRAVGGVATFSKLPARDGCYRSLCRARFSAAHWTLS